MSDNEEHDLQEIEHVIDEDNMDVDTDTDDEDYHPAVDAIGPVLGPIPLPAHLAAILMDPNRLHSYHELFNDRARRFIQDYRVVSVIHLESRGHHQNLESGGKIFLPPSALQQISRNSSALLSPMMFRARNPTNQRSTHCGVLEFIAEEDLCYMPTWMMENLGLIDFDMISIEKVTLPTATFAKFEPQSVDFLDIDNPKAVLENSLRFFTCLTKGDVVAIYYNSRVYKLSVLEILPSNAVSIIECDMNVDFAPPVGYVSPSASHGDMEEGAAGSSDGNAFVPFMGSGNRLNGKTVDTEATTKKITGGAARGSPDTEWKIGGLQFKRKLAKPGGNDTNGEGEQKFQAFGGAGQTLKTRRDDNSDDSFEL